MYFRSNAIVSRALLLGALAAGTAPAYAQGYIEVAPFDASVSAIQKAVRTTPDGSNHSILLALRQLKDPAMRSLFQRLLSSEDPTLRIDALLALAELGDGRIDPFLLKQFGARERIIALAAAIDLELIDTQVANKIANFDDLEPVELAIIIAMQMNLGAEVDQKKLRTLLEDEDTVTRTIAAILLADLGDSSFMKDALKQYAASGPEERLYIASAVTDLASWHPSPGALPLLEIIAHDQDFPRALRLAAVDAALACNCDKGIEVWDDACKLAVSSGDRTRLAVAALERGIVFVDWSGIRDEYRLNQALADAGEALAEGTGLPDRGKALLKSHHPLLTQGALALATHGSTEDAEIIRLAIIEEALRDPRLYPAASRVVTDLSNAKSPQLQVLIERLVVHEDPRVAELAILGLMNAENPQGGELAASFRDHHDRTVRSLALITQARHGIQLDEEQMEELGTIASGGGRVNPSARAVAAWLWLRQSEAQERALARIVGEA